MINNFSNEKSIYDFWEKEKLLGANPKSREKPYSLLVPPPNLTGDLHLGHAMQHAILDALARFRRLQGFDVLLLPGVDHAGIQFEATFDNHLSKQNLSKQKLGREKWLGLAWKFKDVIYKSVSGSWRMMGLSADWSREVFTLDPGPQKAVFEQFKTYYEHRLIYKGPYIVQWCPKDRTAIEDAEVEYEERKEKLYTVRYLIDEGSPSDFIEVATARPETIFADTGIAVYPNHPEFKIYVGKHAFNPLTKELLPIFEDNRVDKDFGTGALKITPGHDLLDYEIGKDHGLKILQVIDKTGRMTNLAGIKGANFKTISGKLIQGLEGLPAADAREKTVDWLKANGALSYTQDYAHAIPVCERCKSVVEPLISEEWFVKVEDLAKGAIVAIKNDEIKFLPGNYAKILVEWLENIHDWCISRSLWWGHRLPVFYCQQVKSSKCKAQKGIIISLEKLKTCPYCASAVLKQDEQVLDTWFSSGLWPLSTLGWPNVKSKVKSQKLKAVEENSLFDRYFPWDFEISAPEIKYLWITRMIMISLYFTGKIPFKTMFFHGMLRDLQGRKFSKSLGNGIEPEYLINKWGVDATRMALYTYSVAGRDGRVSREILDEHGKNFRNFATKIRNIARFVMEHNPPAGGQKSPLHRDFAEQAKARSDFIHEDDKWIRDEAERMAVKVTNNLEHVKLHMAIDEIYNFIWHKFADIYIEKSKSRRADAQPVLEYILKKCLILLHPFMPFLTEELYQRFADHKKSIMLEEWPR